ncbi:hypothetical protein CYLTODRAFT_415544 [Cylindrobasidium torrendii FP15055 ss-10]|uniref:Uncharacterized protein n=1 Tax=Cylindrobasidium torrendii FP15055 ss-10 TaxID=1314674 RepID=A0A0D7ASU7_9AGAR|nr:hypothetical protein CYLTODRAFT_415544 [Cylindrobasidium torrendii FP15055 ss-10]
MTCPFSVELIKNLGEDAQGRQIQLQWHLPHSRLGPWSLATTARCHPAALVPVPVGLSSTTAQPASNSTTEALQNVPVEPLASNVTSRKAQKASLTSFPWKKNPPPRPSQPFKTIASPSAQMRNTFGDADQSVSNIAHNQRSNPLPQQMFKHVAMSSRTTMPHSSMDTAATMTAFHTCSAPPQRAPMKGAPARMPGDHTAMPAVPPLSSDPSIPRSTSLTHPSTFPIPYPNLPPDYAAENPSSMQAFDVPLSTHGSFHYGGPQQGGGAYPTPNGPVMASPSTSPDTLVGSPSPRNVTIRELAALARACLQSTVMGANPGTKPPFKGRRRAYCQINA